jgi:hypothetical protein
MIGDERERWRRMNIKVGRRCNKKGTNVLG